MEDTRRNESILYEEIYTEYQVPFCRPVQCIVSVGEETLINGKRAKNMLWNCLPSDCHIYLTCFLTIIVMLSAMTITFNCLILLTNLASKTRRMRRRNRTITNYSTYVVSLAVADLLVGVVVLPLCVANFYLEFMSGPIPGEALRTIIETNKTMQGANETKADLVSQMATYSEEFDTSYDRPLTEPSVSAFRLTNSMIPGARTTVRNLLGVFTHLTLFVSVYTLISASADRFYAATHSARAKTLRFSKRSTRRKDSWSQKFNTTVRRSTKAVLFVWMLGMVFAIVPLLMRPQFYFRQVGHVFAAMTSDSSFSGSVQWYLFTLVLPLIGMWVLNILICYTLWKRKRQLGLKRKRSLRRHVLSDPLMTRNVKRPVIRVTSAPGGFSENRKRKSTGIPLYPSSRWNEQCDAENDGEDAKTLTSPTSQLSRSQNACDGSPPSSRTSSIIKRKGSSFRRAKELLRNQSYEAHITKTLCIVVITFTIAVLPLIIVLASITHEKKGTSLEKLNTEVTALTCSLLLLFSNSFINCVIYGARMRDFRTSVSHLLRSLFAKVKKVFCCACMPSHNNQHLTENTSGALLKRSRSCEPSPRPENNRAMSRFRYSLRSIEKHKFESERRSLRVTGSNRNSLSPLVDRIEPRRTSDTPQTLQPPSSATTAKVQDAAVQVSESNLSTLLQTCMDERCQIILENSSDIYTRKKQRDSGTLAHSCRRLSWRNPILEGNFEKVSIEEEKKKKSTKPLNPSPTHSNMASRRTITDGQTYSDLEEVKLHLLLKGHIEEAGLIQNEHNDDSLDQMNSGKKERINKSDESIHQIREDNFESVDEHADRADSELPEKAIFSLEADSSSA